MGYIIDISHHQDPAKIDYDVLAKQLDFAIIRTQYGSKTIDRHYKTHHEELRKRGVPTAAYAWVRGVSYGDMQLEAQDFYNRTQDLEPTFWFLDIEEESMEDMRYGVKAYVQKLRELGAKKVGAYIAHHFYSKFNIDTADFDAIWIPRYGANNGELHNMKPNYPCDIWQYTSVGRLDGYAGNLDLNVLTGTKPIEFFTGKKEVSKINIASKTGDKQIKSIQSILNKRYNAGLVVDGFYGPKTKRALIKGYQIELNRQFNAKLAVDGVWGPKTRAATVMIRKGAKGNLTWILQAVLYCNGYDPKWIDGIFGDHTEKALKEYQRDKKILVDGIAGKETFEMLFNSK